MVELTAKWTSDWLNILNIWMNEYVTTELRDVAASQPSQTAMKTPSHGWNMKRKKKKKSKTEDFECFQIANESHTITPGISFLVSLKQSLCCCRFCLRLCYSGSFSVCLCFLYLHLFGLFLCAFWSQECSWGHLTNRPSITLSLELRDRFWFVLLNGCLFDLNTCLISCYFIVCISTLHVSVRNAYEAIIWEAPIASLPCKNFSSHQMIGWMSELPDPCKMAWVHRWCISDVFGILCQQYLA